MFAVDRVSNFVTMIWCGESVWLVVFFNFPDVSCTPGDIRLYNSSAPGQGMLQQCNSSYQWSAVCDRDWDCNEAKVACRQLGFNDSS